MSIPNPQISDDALPSQNPTLVEDQQCEDQRNPHPDSQSPKTLVSDHPDLKSLAEQDANTNSHKVAQEPENQRDSCMEVQTDPQIADDPDASSAPSSQNADINVAVSDATSRRGPKRKKMGHKRTAQEKKSREKLQVLVETLKPIPFVPSKALDFTSHETLLRRLGLWDFVHIEFDQSIRTDLVAQLIAGYTPSTRYCYVNESRIMVNRADLGRALKLPVKKNVVTDDVLETLDLAESIAFIEEVVSNWMLLHEDTYIVPSEVLAYTKMIKEGHLEKVDWAGLIWHMVEKELKAPQLVNCYYASHLQQLIKVQREELLTDESKVEIEVKDEEDEEEDEDGSGDLKIGGAEDGSGGLKMGGVEDGSGDLKMGGVEDGSGDLKMGGVEDGSGDLKMGGVEDGNSDLKMGAVDDGRAQELEEHNIELSLGQDNVEKVEVEKERVEKVEVENEQDVGEHMDFEESKEEEPAQWFLDQKNNVGEPFLRHCNMGDVNNLDCEPKKEEEGEEGQEEGEEGGEEEEEEEDAEEEEHEGGFHLSPKCIPLEGMSSGSLIQAMEVGQMPFSSGIELRDNSVGDFLSSREDAQMISGTSLFNGHKRDICQENNNSHHSLNGSNKRLRSDSPWNAKPVDFEMCMEQIEHWMGKARVMYATKEQSCEESTMHQQILLNEVQKRDSMIDHLHKEKMEESQKRQMEVYRLEKELYMMSNLLEGYRKALKESQKAFAEYRSRCPQADEPLYKDVPGSGGLVLSVMELEKERLKREEEERTRRLIIEKKLRDFEEGWIGKLEDHLNGIQLLGNKLLAIEDQVKKLNAKRKVLDPPECAPSEEQTA